MGRFWEEKGYHTARSGLNNLSLRACGPRKRMKIVSGGGKELGASPQRRC